MPKYLRITFSHSTDPLVDGDLTKSEARKLIAKQATNFRCISSKEVIREEYRGEIYTEIYFDTITYHEIPKELDEWDECELVNNADYSEFHNLGSRFDSAIAGEDSKILTKIPQGITVSALPKISV